MKLRPELTPVTYEEMADIFRVDIKTIRNWKYKKLFKIMGYEKLPGFGKKQALVEPEEVRRLTAKRLIKIQGKYAFKK